MRPWFARAFGLVCLLFFTVACAPTVMPSGLPSQTPLLSNEGIVTTTGARLPIRIWKPTGAVESGIVVLAVHGFNDYSHFFEEAGTYFATHGVTSYAFDQRGFGNTDHRGLWAGIDAYSNDLTTAAALIRHAHPSAKLFILGESMGGAFAMIAAARMTLPVDGLIVSAPAVWGRATMPWYQQAALWLGAHSLPWITLTGRGLNRVPSDNIEMLRALGRDPLVIKETRIDSVYGLVNAMDAALVAAAHLPGPTLYLYGRKDDIVPMEPTLRAARLAIQSQPESTIFAAYDSGHHMLLRDLNARIVWNDIIAWIESPLEALPSSADVRGAKMIQTNGVRTNDGVIGSDN